MIWFVRPSGILLVGAALLCLLLVACGTTAPGEPIATGQYHVDVIPLEPDEGCDNYSTASTSSYSITREGAQVTIRSINEVSPAPIYWYGRDDGSAIAATMSTRIELGCPIISKGNLRIEADGEGGFTGQADVTITICDADPCFSPLELVGEME